MNELTQYCYEGDWQDKHEIERQLENVKPKEYIRDWGVVGTCERLSRNGVHKVLILRKGNEYKYVKDAPAVMMNIGGKFVYVKR